MAPCCHHYVTLTGLVVPDEVAVEEYVVSCEAVSVGCVSSGRTLFAVVVSISTVRFGSRRVCASVSHDDLRRHYIRSVPVLEELRVSHLASICGSDI